MSLSEAIDATTFEDKGVIKYMNANFYPVKLDVIGPLPGYLTKDQLLPALKYFGNNTF